MSIMPITPPSHRTAATAANPLERRVHQVGRDNLALAQALGQFQ
jgi:hypothetical protein